MNPNKTRFALAALLAAFALPAFAASPADCTPCSDPLFPKVESPAPPLAIHGKGQVFETQFWPDGIRVTTPGIALRVPADSPPAPEPSGDEAPTALHFAELSSPAQLAAHQ